jgi:hypothetical protein
MLAHDLLSAALTIKHAGFAEEAEWRLIDDAERRDEAAYRRGAFGMTPYLTAALPERWRNWPLGIARVIVGPSPNAAATADSVAGLLRGRLESRAEVVDCGIPYRS